MAKRQRLADLIHQQTQQPASADLTEPGPEAGGAMAEVEVTSAAISDQPQAIAPSESVTETAVREIEPSEVRTELPPEHEPPEGEVSEPTALAEPEAAIAESSSEKIVDVQPEKMEQQQEEEKLPRYLTLIRKETRLREDQVEALTILARKLNRKKRGGERITENTLIRVAVDLLLSQSEHLQGMTEAEIRTALGFEITE